MIKSFHQFFENNYLIDSIWCDEIKSFVHYRFISPRNIPKIIKNHKFDIYKVKFLEKNKIKFIVGFDDNHNLVSWLCFMVINGVKQIINWESNNKSLNIGEICSLINAQVLEIRDDNWVKFKFSDIEEFPGILIGGHSHCIINSDTKEMKYYYTISEDETEVGRINTNIFYYNPKTKKLELLGLKVINNVLTGQLDIYLWRRYVIGGDYKNISIYSERLPYDPKTYKKIIVYSEYDDEFYYVEDCVSTDHGYINLAYKDKNYSLYRINFEDRPQSYNFACNFVKSLHLSRWYSPIVDIVRPSFTLDKQNRKISFKCKFSSLYVDKDNSHDIVFTISERHNGYHLNIEYTYKLIDTTETRTLSYDDNIETISKLKGDELPKIVNFLGKCREYIRKKDKYTKTGRSRRNKR